MNYRALIAVAAALTVTTALMGVSAASGPPSALDCAGAHASECASVLPAAATFEPAGPDKAWFVGRDDGGEVVGWLMLSTDAVDIPGYSGKPLVTLVGLDPKGVITGATVIHHSEPILLVGIPRSALDSFVDFYAGKPAITQVVVGSSPDPDAVEVDMISGATVTALAENQTILETGRHLGVSVGVINSESINPGHFVHEDRPWTWQELVDGGVFGQLTVRESEMGFEGAEGVFVDILFTVADATHVGKALLGGHEYAYHMGRLAPSKHLVVVVGSGSSSFKGSGFVRGGLFDRVRIEQGMRTVMFRDTDYTNLGRLAAAGAPEFKEGAIFVARDGRLDPGAAFELVFVGSRYDGRGGFTRDFHAFKASLRLPETVYAVEGGSRDLGAEISAQAWYNNRYEVALVAIFLLLVMGLFVARRWLTGSMKRLRVIHIGVLLFSFVVLGLVLHAQPSITQVLTLVGAAVGDFDIDLFLTEPAIFVFWIFIAIVLFAWGRGVFCGWVCPYGALTELLFKLGRVLKLRHIDLPDGVHRKARWIRYVILLVLIPAFLVSPETGEQLAEVEPFKSTFFVAPWDREALYLIWWVLLLAPTLVWYRPFCRYLCPLGAALAVPGSLRISGPHRRNFCTNCKVCNKGCEPLAIRPNGTIDARECLSCMECEANYRDEQVCPPLIAIDRLRISGQRDGVAPDPARIARLERDIAKVTRSSRRAAKP